MNVLLVKHWTKLSIKSIYNEWFELHENFYIQSINQPEIKEELERKRKNCEIIFVRKKREKGKIDNITFVLLIRYIEGTENTVHHFRYFFCVYSFI